MAHGTKKMREEFRPAIDLLQKDLAELERKIAETKMTINRLHEAAGDPLPYPEAELSNKKGGIPRHRSTRIRPDTFYGKPITTAAREYLEMRKSADMGPASPREVFEALKLGGYRFSTKDETNAMIGVRATLRKNSSIFHRLPSGEYGLLSWYPNAKAPKDDSDD